MTSQLRFFKPRPLLLGVVVFAALGSSTAPVMARKKVVNRLQIWPGQRILIVLPLSVSPDFLSPDTASSGPASAAPSTPTDAPAPASAPATVSAPAPVSADVPLTAAPASGAGTAGSAMTSGQSELATALVPVISSQLSSALINTGKFSLVLPYRFDPILRRASIESAISDDELNTFISTPTLEAAQGVLPKLTDSDQPGMIARVTLESLKIGGTAQAPTAQVRMRGELYQAVAASADATQPAAAQLFRSLTVTSKPYTGRTPEDRLRAAAGEAFNDIAAAFVEPPAEFSLPVPVGPAANSNKNTRGGFPMSPGGDSNSGNKGGGMTSVPLVPAMPGGTPSTSPNPLSPAPGTTPIAPILPPATPPLGLNVPPQP